MTTSALAGWMLRVFTRLVPEDSRDSVLGDLLEEAEAGGESRGTGWVLTRMMGITLMLRWDRARSGFVGTGSRPPTDSPSRGPGSMPGILLGDLRYAVRSLRKSPGFTAIVVLSLALGIGATSTIFSALNPILLRPLPFPDPDRLVEVYETSAEGRRRTPRESTHFEWKEHGSLFEQLEWNSMGTYLWTSAGIDGAEKYAAQDVHLDLFRFLGVEPILGRHFVAGEGEEPYAVILSYGFWQRRFGGDPDIVGQTWAQGWANRRVVGVMPPGFQIYPWNEADFWVGFERGFGDNSRSHGTIGRLNPGVSVEAAQAQLDAIARRLEQSGVSETSGWRVRVTPLNERMSERYGGDLYLLMGAALLVLLIACSNVASLLVGRATNRHRELTTRVALGAGRLRLMRQLLTESVVLAMFGGVLGVLLAQVGTRLFVSLNPTWYPPSEQIRVDGTVLAFTLGVSLLTAILFGIAPALRASNPDLARSLKQGGRGSPGGSRPLVQNLLVGSQIAITLVLLTGAALMVNSFVRLATVDLGFNPERLLTAQVDFIDPYAEELGVHSTTGGTALPGVDLFYREVIERLRAVPGVEAAEMAGPIIIGQRGFTLLGRPTPPPDEQPLAEYRQASPGFFSVMGIPVSRGRSFTERDTESSPWVAIITESMARRYFPDEDPIGKFLQAEVGSQLSPAGIDKPREIVGVVGDHRERNPRRVPRPSIYVPTTQHPTEYVGRGAARRHTTKHLVLRTTLESASLAADLRRIVGDVHSGVAVVGIETMEAMLGRSVTLERFWMLALGIFATLALVLAVIGIYGVVSYAVTQRTHEIGVRMALGAQRTDVLGMVIRQGMVIAIGGVVMGVLGAVAATRLLSSWLYGVEATDPVTFAIVSVLLVGITLLAAYVPARRAARVDPLIALRSE